jgi:hypothetical protein
MANKRASPMNKMAKLNYDDFDWVSIDDYVEGEHEVTVEALFLDGDEQKEDSKPILFQVYCKPPWKKIIGPTENEPTDEDIRSALDLSDKPPEFMYLKASTNVLKNLFLNLIEESKARGHCIVCRKSLRMGSHEPNCILWQSERVINAQIQWRRRQG